MQIAEGEPPVAAPEGGLPGIRRTPPLRDPGARRGGAFRGGRNAKGRPFRRPFAALRHPYPWRSDAAALGLHEVFIFGTTSSLLRIARERGCFSNLAASMTQRLQIVNRLTSPSGQPFLPAWFLPAPVLPGRMSRPRICKEGAIQGPNPRCIIPWIDDPAPACIPTAR